MMKRIDKETLLWAEKKLGRPLSVYENGRHQYVQLSDADIEKLSSAPSTMKIIALLVAGFVFARLLMWAGGLFFGS